MKHRMPRNCKPELSLALEELICALPFGAELIQRGWFFAVTDTNRGWCNYTNKTITIPLWAWNSARPGYSTYYLAHEIAHAIGPHKNHGAEFMRAFKHICPKELQHWELEYKPANAKAAGIAVPIPDDL